MNEEKPPLAAALRHLAERERRSLTEHPTPQELASYHAGELPPEAEARLREHLAICRECSDLLLDLAGFATLTPPQGVPELTDDEVEQDWQALRARMGEVGAERQKPAEVVPIRPVASPTRPGWLPVAASLLAVLGFSFGIYQTVRLERALQPNLVRLIDPGLAVRGDELVQSFSVRQAGVVHLRPDPDVERDYGSYEAEIANGDEVVARLPVATIEEEDPFVLIPPGFLEPGTYQAYLYGIDGEQRKQLSEVRFRVNDP